MKKIWSGEVQALFGPYRQRIVSITLLSMLASLVEAALLVAFYLSAQLGLQGGIFIKPLGWSVKSSPTYRKPGHHRNGFDSLVAALVEIVFGGPRGRRRVRNFSAENFPSRLLPGMRTVDDAWKETVRDQPRSSRRSAANQGVSFT